MHGHWHWIWLVNYLHLHLHLLHRQPNYSPVVWTRPVTQRVLSLTLPAPHACRVCFMTSPTVSGVTESALNVNVRHAQSSILLTRRSYWALCFDPCHGVSLDFPGLLGLSPVHSPAVTARTRTRTRADVDLMHVTSVPPPRPRADATLQPHS